MSANQIKSSYVKYFPIDIYDNFIRFVKFRYPNMSEDKLNALVHITYDIHSTRNDKVYSINTDDKIFLLEFSEELRQLNDTYYSQESVNIATELSKQIKIPYQFYIEDGNDFIYFKDQNNKMYMTELYFDYFEIFEVDTSGWDDCPKLSKYSVDAEEVLYEHKGYSDKWNYNKIIRANGFYCALYRVVTNKDVFKYYFNIIECRDGKIYIKDNKNKFTTEINFMFVICWYNKKF